MLLTCPGCSQSFNSREPLRIGEMDVSCPNCRAAVTVVTTVKTAKTPEASVRRPLSPERTVLVAVEGAATKEMIQEVLMAGGYETAMVSTGKEALAALERSVPSVSLLDVGLPEIMGFELCERIKKNERFKDMKIILVASIYDKKRYKREPDSLYGADDYIERHDIQDRLLSKIEEVLAKPGPAPRELKSAPEPSPTAHKTASPVGGTTSAPVRDMNTDSIFLEEATVYEPGLHAPKPVPRPHATPAPIEVAKNQLEEEATVYEPGLHVPKPMPYPHAAPAPLGPAKNAPVSGDPAKHEAAKRLARLILSDIALYNPRAVEQGIRNNTFHQLLKSELEEGRKLYRSRVSSDVVPDYYDQAIEEFIRKRKGGN